MQSQISLSRRRASDCHILANRERLSKCMFQKSNNWLVCNLYEFVRSIITTPNLPFDLSTTNDMTANLADPQVLLPRKTRLVESNPGLLWLNHAFGQGTVLQIVSDTTQTGMYRGVYY